MLSFGCCSSCYLLFLVGFFFVCHCYAFESCPRPLLLFLIQLVSFAVEEHCDDRRKLKRNKVLH